ncbi:glycosyltransferase [Desulfococcaceae bacterium HSG7]|nr:glycosyltransferase [Desulfococcaceae bacterium HSG7]
MSKPLISVVIPAYNHEKFVGAAIESVLEQSYHNFEIVIIDDGSTDQTAKVVQSYKDSRIKYLYQDNQDAYNTINRGMGLACGDFIAILNSDDIYAPNRLARLLEVQKKTQAVCIFTDVTPIDDNDEVLDNPEFGWNGWHQKNRNFYFKTRDLYTAFLKSNFMVTTSNLFMCRDAVKKVGKFSSLRYLHDYDFIFRMMLAFPHGVVYLDDEKLLCYRIHSGNTLNQAAIIGREQDKMIIRKYMLAKIPENQRLRIDHLVTRLIEIELLLIKTRMAVYAKPLMKLYKYVSLYLLEWRSQIIKSFIFHKNLKDMIPILKTGTERLVELECELVEVHTLLRGKPLQVPRKTEMPFNLVRYFLSDRTT